MIASAGLSLTVLAFYDRQTVPADWWNVNPISLLIFGVGLVILRRWKVNPVYVMAGAGVLGVLLYSAL